MAQPLGQVNIAATTHRNDVVEWRRRRLRTRPSERGGTQGDAGVGLAPSNTTLPISTPFKPAHNSAMTPLSRLKN